MDVTRLSAARLLECGHERPYLALSSGVKHDSRAAVQGCQMSTNWRSERRAGVRSRRGVF
jgi:hypothetical protein